MPRTNVAAQSLPSTYYPTLPLSGGSADIAFTATDAATDMDTALVDGKTMVLVKNEDVDPQTVTFTSVVDSLNRVGDIEAYSVAAGKVARFGPFKLAGWSAAGKLQWDVSDPLLRSAVIQLP